MTRLPGIDPSPQATVAWLLREAGRVAQDDDAVATPAVNRWLEALRSHGYDPDDLPLDMTHLAHRAMVRVIAAMALCPASLPVIFEDAARELSA